MTGSWILKLGNENANSSLHMAERTGTTSTGRNTSDNRDSSTAPAAPKAKRVRVAAKLAKSAQVVAKHTAPQAPERKEREAGSPPPQASKKNNNQKRSRGQNLKNGLWLRQPSSDNIDHARIPDPQCPLVNCSLACCFREGFSAADIMQIREQYRQQQRDGGHERVASFLRNLMRRRAKRSRKQFERRAKVPAALNTKGCCSWCTTVHGPIHRNHQYRQARCPRWHDGQQYLLNTPVLSHRFFMPPIHCGAGQRPVSAGFFRSMFQLSTVRVMNLERSTTKVDFSDVLSRCEWM